MRENPFLRGKIYKRVKARGRWMERQVRPAVPKDLGWVQKFRDLPHLGLRILLAAERLDPHTTSEYIYDVME